MIKIVIVYLKRVLFVFAEEINKLLKEKKKTSKDKKIIEKTIINLDEIDNLYIDPNTENLASITLQKF